MDRGVKGLPRRLMLGMMLLVLACRSATAADDFEKARGAFLSGDYAGSIALAEEAVKDTPDSEDWQLLLTDGLLAVGRYPEAGAAITNALAENPRSIRLRWRARQVFQYTGQTDSARDMADQIVQMVSARPTFYRDGLSLVAFGRAALLEPGADPKRILNKIFQSVQKRDPTLKDAYLASGELALDKHDFALAAKTFQEGLKQLPDDPDLKCGLAQAYAPSDQPLMIASLEVALARNSNHVGSLLLLADYCIDAEDYSGAEKILDRIKVINPWQPDAWAYRAVLAQLQNQPEAEQAARQTALKFWPTNPRVDYLIGLKLAQNYRFAEGAAYQRAALQHDPNYLPAKTQLAQNLLRLGDETEGWKLAEAVQKQDAYDVEAYNLATLHDAMGKFTTLTNRDFVVRMGAHEAAIYGPRALELLTQARNNLCAKFGLELSRPTLVEIFPEQKDFAVRTFGMPGNPGYLGVCFGNVITANDPAAHPGHPVNWQAVLWHEFCHVVTLNLTRNKMPRWLSEGISVYEESQANPTWGQHMNPQYREMILGGELTPVSKLSAAFLSPKSDLHLQFAYYESSLVVEFLVQRFGLDQLKAILRDLGDGAEINQAIAKHTEPMADVEKEFATFARERAQKLAPGLDWEKPDLKTFSITQGRSSSAKSPVFVFTGPHVDAATWNAWAKRHPTNFWVMTQRAQELVDDEQWQQAKTVLQQLVNLYPDFIGPESAYRMLALAHRELNETNAERQVLARWAEKDDEATDAYLRLMELAADVRDWPAVIENVQRYLAVDPLVAPPYRFLAQAAEQSGRSQMAITAYRALLELDPPDPAQVHFRLAKLLYAAGDPTAKRQVLQALEEAPRFREALQLLLQIENKNPAQTRAEPPYSFAEDQP